MTALVTTDYALLPPLSTDEFDALKASIKRDGVLQPIIVDEAGDILDGHHRYKCDKNAPRRVVKGLSPAEKQALVFQVNFARRNLSPDQKREATRRMKAMAKALREEDPKKNTQKQVAATLGVSRQCVEAWFNRPDRSKGTPNATSSNGRTPDARIKIPVQARSKIVERVDAGETQEQVAADYGVGRQQISRIAKAEKKQQAVKTRSGKVSDTQRDTFNVLNQMLTHYAHKRNVRQRRGQVKIFYHGLHLLHLSETTPDDSRTITWDGKQIDRECLVELLRFRRDAHTLKPREERSHKKKDTTGEPFLPLVFGGQGRSGRNVAESAIVYGIGLVGLIITLAVFAAAGAPREAGRNLGAPLSPPAPSAPVGFSASFPSWRASVVDALFPGVRLFIRSHSARPSLLLPEPPSGRAFRFFPPAWPGSGPHLRYAHCADKPSGGGLSRGRAEVACRAHNPEVGGSIPPPVNRQ